MGGGYPCHCGAYAEDFRNPSRALKPCHYCSMQDRVDEFRGKGANFSYRTKDLSVSHKQKFWEPLNVVLFFPVTCNMFL